MAKSKGSQQQEKQTAPESRRESSQQNAITQSQSNQQMGLSRREPGLFTNPFSLMRRFGEDMEQFFEEFGFGGMRRFGQVASWMPQIEVRQQDGQLVIRADLPGLNKDNVQVEVREDAVVLRGERRDEREEEREGFFRTERSYGSFYREIPLPPDVDTSKATATFRDGVLEITMPSSQARARGRQLEIKESQAEEQPRQRAQAAGTGR